LHNVEREGFTDLWPSTFHALDTGLEWPEGTAAELAKGNADAITDVLSTDDRIEYVRQEMLGKVARMSLEELETLVELWEGHVLGKPAKSTAEHIAMVESRLQTLEKRLNETPGGLG